MFFFLLKLLDALKANLLTGIPTGSGLIKICGSGYNQSNAYAGGGNGVMGGFETLPSSVPAAQMVYDHVARVIAPSFTGYANSFPAVVNSGESHTINFSFLLNI